MSSQQSLGTLLSEFRDKLDLFGHKSRAAERHVLEQRIAKLEARAVCANTIAYYLLQIVDVEQRQYVLSQLQTMVADAMNKRSPSSIPKQYHQTFRDELSRSFQVLMEATEERQNRPDPLLPS